MNLRHLPSFHLSPSLLLGPRAWVAGGGMPMSQLQRSQTSHCSIWRKATRRLARVFADEAVTVALDVDQNGKATTVNWTEAICVFMYVTFYQYWNELVLMDGNGWEWMGMDGNGWEWMGMDGNGWEWMGMDGNGGTGEWDYCDYC